MNREIKFRGYSMQLGQWLYGSFVTGLFENNKTKEDCPIIIDATLYPDYSCLADFDDMDCEVVASSVGQLTGLKDKNGVDVYEGDVMKWLNPQTGIEGLSEVRYNDRLARFQMIDGEVWYGINPPVQLEVLGNIYEHPHLLK